MADDILNMSLDDIIKKNAEKAKQAKPRKPKAAGKDQPKAGKPNRLGRVNQGAIGKKPQAVRVRGSDTLGIGIGMCTLYLSTTAGSPGEDRIVRDKKRCIQARGP